MNLGPHHHDAAADDRWRGDAVETPVHWTTQPLCQVDAPILAKGRDRLARLRVQADQVAVAGAEQDALIVPVRPVGHAAMNEAIIGRDSVLPCLRVVNPFDLAGGSVDGSDLGHRGADIHHAVDHQRGGLPHPGFQIRIRFRDRFFGGAPGPRDLEAIEIVCADLIERRIFRVGLVAAVAQPFRRRALNLPRPSMRGTADRHPRVRGLSRLHGGGHSSQERRCDQGRPGYQSFTPAQHSMDMLLIGIVTSIAHGRFPL